MTSRAPFEVRVAADTGDILGESPVWDPRSGSLFWIDVRRPALHRFDQIGGRVQSWPMPSLLGAIVLRRAGGLVVALRDRLCAFDPASSELTPIIGDLCSAPDIRLNDGKCDRAGRIWLGRMRDFGADDSGGLLRFESGGAVEEVRSGVRIPNAIAFSPDGGTIYFTDTRAGDILSARVDMASGSCGPWSLFAPAGIAPGHADGATVDADGCLWNARFGGSAIARITPQGKLDRLVGLPVSQPTSCAFGGPGLATLYITTARQKLDAAVLEAEPLAGALLAIEVGAQGLPEPAFGPAGQ